MAMHASPCINYFGLFSKEINPNTENCNLVLEESGQK